MKMKKLFGALALTLLVAGGAWASTFKDDTGREFTFKKGVHKVAPSGSVAQVLLLTFDSDKMVGVSRKLGGKTLAFLPERLAALPEFGQFYGKNVTLNLEALIKAAPDAIVDMGQKKKTITEDMDGVGHQTGIPALFIQAELKDMGTAYRRLGELFGDPARGEVLGAWADEALAYAKDHREDIQKAAPKVYLALGDDGLSTNARGSFHAEVLDLVGVTNVVDLEASNKGAGTQVSMEKLVAWSPEFILVESAKMKDFITSDPAWQALDAVKKGNVFVIPNAPFNIVLNPPSANRLLGLYWLGHLVAPQVYDFDMAQKAWEFYDTFWKADLTDSQLEEILAGGSLKK